MTRKKLALIIAALCLAAAIILSMALFLRRDQRPEANTARFVSAAWSAARRA